MDEKKLESFRQKLVEMRSKISGEFEQTLESSSEEFRGSTPDVNDEASRTISRRILLEIGDKSHEALQNIEDALERIEDGEYGVCEECGEDIPEKRLDLVPHAIHCVGCQQKLESARQVSG